MTRPAERPPLTAIVPLKAIPQSKTRMMPQLSVADRALLLQRTFDRVTAALAGATSVGEVLVVVGDARGRSWARDLGLPTLDEPGGGLNAALAAADAHLGDHPTLVVPADLPLVTAADVDQAVGAVTAAPSVVVAPTADGGTGALIRVPGQAIVPCFGPGSARAHLEEARRVGVAAHVVDIPGLALDLDRPADIAQAGGWSVVTGGRSLAT